jgi:arylsulfatase
MVARWPGRIKPAATSEHISAFWDWLPTLCEVAGVKLNKKADGISLLPALTGKTQKTHEFLYWEFPGYGSQQVLRMGDWKGVRQNISRARTSAEMKTELYNLKSDPGEKNNVAARHPGVIAKIEAIMAQEHTPSSLFPILPEERRGKRLNK